MLQFPNSVFEPEITVIFTFLVATITLTLLYFVFTPWLGRIVTNQIFPRSAALKLTFENYVTVMIGVAILPFLIPCKFLFYKFQGVFRVLWRKICWVYLHLIDIYDRIGASSLPSNDQADDKTLTFE